MLIALIFSALSASASVAGDSVRLAPKSGGTRPDTTILSMPAPTIALPPKSAPEVVQPMRPVTSIAAPRASLPVPSVVPQAGAGVVQQSGTTVAARPTVTAPTSKQEVVAGSAAAPSAATPTASAPAEAPKSPPAEAPKPASVATPATAAAATPAPPAVSTPAPNVAPTPAPPAAPPAATASGAKATTDAKPTSTAAPAPAPASAPSAAVAPAAAPTPTAAPVRDSAAIKAPPVAAPADAVATASAGPRALVTTTRVDPRTVVSVRSSERFEPLYAVPIPSAGVRLPAPTIADSIVVFKRERTLVLYNRGVPIRSYFIALGAKPVGDKERAGDHKTPEGLFYINAHNPASKFHLALRISYPSDAHRARAAALGVDPGGDIMIHGLPKEFSEAGKKHLQNDWTNGCVALSNQEIEEIWQAVPDGTPVQIKP